MLCVIKKRRNISYKLYIRFKNQFLKLIYSDIYEFTISRDYNNNKYFIVFINN